MKKIIFILIITCIIQTSCKGQNDKNIDNNKNSEKIKSKKIMKKLDENTIAKFKSLNKQQYIDNDTIYKLEEFDKIYSSSTKSLKGFITEYETYDKQTLKIKRYGKQFKGIYVGIHKFYDEKGNIEKIINFDDGFDFTVDDLILKMSNEFNTDIINSKDIDVARGTGKPYMIPTYNITFPVFDENKIRTIILDGVTGEVLEDKIDSLKE